MWRDLNERQQHYLRAIYTADQEQEQEQKWERATNHLKRHPPASVWRWIKYHPTSVFENTTRLQDLIGSDHINEGTGSTFEALEQRGLIECQYKLGLLSVKITAAGRKLVRANLPDNEKPQRKPKGALSYWTWKHLKMVYEAGERGLEDKGFAAYGGTQWHRVWADFQVRDWIFEFGSRLHLTDKGRAIYEERLTMHQALYSDLYEVAK